MGNRLLRHYAPQLGLDPAFTVIDRSDSADLLDQIRTELGFAAKEQRFPRKDTCLAIYSHRVNTQQAAAPRSLEQQFPWCLQWEQDLTQLYRAYVERKQQLQPARLRRPAAVLARAGVGAEAGAARGRALRPHPGGRVPGYQPPAGADPRCAQTRWRRPHRGGRRRAGHLLVPRGGSGQHPGLSAALSRRRPKWCRWARTTARRSRCSMPPMR